MPGGKILPPSKDKAKSTDKNWVLQYTTGYDILRVEKIPAMFVMMHYFEPQILYGMTRPT